MLVVLYRLNSLHTFNTPNEEGAIQTQDAYFHYSRHTFRYNTYEDDEMVFPVHSQDMHSCTHDLSSIARAPLAFDPIVTFPGFGRNVLYGLQTGYILPDNLQTDVPLHKRCAWMDTRHNEVLLVTRTECSMMMVAANSPSTLTNTRTHAKP